MRSKKQIYHLRTDSCHGSLMLRDQLIWSK